MEPPQPQQQSAAPAQHVKSNYLHLLLIKDLTAKIQEVLKAHSPPIDATTEEIEGAIAPPTKAKAADLAVPAFPFAKKSKLPPPKIAAYLGEKLTNAVPGVTVAVEGPYVNLTLTPTYVAGILMPHLTAHPTTYTLSSSTGAGKTVCIDFSSPNIAKHLAFHHIRSTMIGNALYLMYKAAGWNVVRINFLGDWGTAFGRLIAGWKREGITMEKLNAAENKVTFLNDLYVRISKLAKEQPEVKNEARAWSKKLEDGDKEARELWQVFRDASLAEFRRIYALLGVDFDSWKGEAYFADKMDPILKELESKGLLKEDQGATVVDLSSLGFKKPCMIKRSDGASLYATRDMAACDDRFAEFKFDRSLYVVDAGQSLHFSEWFAVAKLLNRTYVDRLRHDKFGVMLMYDEGNQSWEKTATRKGAPILLNDVLQDSITRAREIMKEKNPEIDPASAEADELARDIGVGAVVFNDLKNSRVGDVKLRFDEILKFEGYTGPYVQFTHARLCSIERKFAATFPNPPKPNWALLTRDDEKAVLLQLLKIQPQFERAVETDEPSTLITQILQFAGVLSSWLTAGNNDISARILCEDPAVAATRLELVKIAKANIAEGLRLVGLKAPKRM